MSNRLEGIPISSSHEGDEHEVIAQAGPNRYPSEKLKEINEGILHMEEVRNRLKEAWAEYDRISEKIKKCMGDWNEYSDRVHAVKDEYIESEEGREKLKLGVDNLRRYAEMHSILAEHKKLINEKLDGLKREFAETSRLIDLTFIEFHGGIAENN